MDVTSAHIFLYRLRQAASHFMLNVLSSFMWRALILEITIIVFCTPYGRCIHPTSRGMPEEISLAYVDIFEGSFFTLGLQISQAYCTANACLPYVDF